MSSRISRKKSSSKEEDENRMKIIKECLTCSVLKTNYIDDPTICLGYPIVQTKNPFSPIKMELYPIPEMLTYEGFLSQMNNQQEKLDLYFETKFKASNNELYNCWIPVYINKTHYEKNKASVLNSFSIIKYGPEGKKEYDFKPEQIFEILPIVLNKMIIGMLSGKSEISSAFIRSYFQYVLLFKKLCLEFEDENLAYLNKILSLVYDNDYKIDKKIIPDIGNFFMILFYCNKDTHSEDMKKMWYTLFEDHLTRQMFWTFHGDECRETMKKLVLKSKNNQICLDRFEKESNFKMRHLDKFNQDLHDLKLFDDVVKIISEDEEFLEQLINDKDKAKNEVIDKMDKNFKNLFNNCSKEGKKAISEIISKNLNFSDYFDNIKYNDRLYDNFKVSELLRDENLSNKKEILEYAFKSQKGNSLLIITFFAQKKIEEEGFMDELEKNYGIYLDVDNFIEEMNKKLEEIKSISEMFDYIGSDFGKDKDELELIIEAYDRAIEKGYIKKGNRERGINNQNRMIGAGEINERREIRQRGIGLGDRGRNMYRGGIGRDRGRNRGRGGWGRGRGRGGFYRGRERSRDRDRERDRSRDGDRNRDRERDRRYSRDNRRY